MPRYFFAVKNGVREADHDGTELPNPRAARLEAISFAASILRDDPDIVWDGRPFCIHVTDAEGACVVDVVVQAEYGPEAAKPVDLESSSKQNL